MNSRIIALIRYMQKPGGVCASDIQENLEVSRASVYRYLQTIQYEMHLPVSSETRDGKTYYFFDQNLNINRSVIESISLLPGDFSFTSDERLLLEFIFSDAERNPSIKDSVKALHEKMSTLLAFAGHVVANNAKVTGIAADIKLPVRSIQTFEELPKKVDDSILENLSKLSDAVKNHKVCKVTYKSTFPERIRSYRLMPLTVFSYKGGFYTIAETEKYDFTSKYSVERFIDIEVTEESFSRKTTLDVNRVLTDPFGIIQGDQFEADILIKKSAVNAVVTRQWPEDRVTFSAPEKNGDVMMHVVTSGEYELVRWLCYMGDEVELQKPLSLRSRVIETAKEIIKGYSGKKDSVCADKIFIQKLQ